MTDSAFQVEDVQPAEVQSPILYKFTNDAESPWLDSLLAMWYKGAYDNTIGIMNAFNLETSEEELILVGVHLDEDNKPECYPLASVIKAEHVGKYLAPNGKGGFYDPRNPSEVAEAKEAMRSFDESIVPAVEPEADVAVN